MLCGAQLALARARNVPTVSGLTSPRSRIGWPNLNLGPYYCVCTYYHSSKALSNQGLALFVVAGRLARAESSKRKANVRQLYGGWPLTQAVIPGYYLTACCS